MGVLNVTPDSFSDGGDFLDSEAALAQARSMIAAGAAILDVGGESTRPNADVIGVQHELDRVLPVIEAIRSEFDVAISIDTSKPAVMREAVEAGATMINDVNALQTEGALAAAVSLQKPVCLMHMQGDPRSMQSNPEYDDVVAEVTQFLQARVAQCVAAGLNQELLIVDPGFGFGKTVEQNVELLANLRRLQNIGCPVLIGVSRKSTLGTITGRDVGDRKAASVAAAAIAVLHGAKIVRAHDVKETVDAVKVAHLISEAGRQK
jgi:dihydropteroate synthase